MLSATNNYFLGWSIDGETIIDVATYKIRNDATFIAIIGVGPIFTTTIIDGLISSLTSIEFDYGETQSNILNGIERIYSQKLSEIYVIRNFNTTRKELISINTSTGIKEYCVINGSFSIYEKDYTFIIQYRYNEIFHDLTLQYFDIDNISNTNGEYLSENLGDNTWISASALNSYYGISVSWLGEYISLKSGTYKLYGTPTNSLQQDYEYHLTYSEIIIDMIYQNGEINLDLQDLRNSGIL